MQRVEAALLPRIRCWWRPVTCVWLSLAVLVNGVVLPVWHFAWAGELATDLSALSMLIAAVVAAFGVREWGKAKGNEAVGAGQRPPDA